MGTGFDSFEAHHALLTSSPSMSKRHAAGSSRSRKKSKRSGYALVDLDPPDEHPEEVEFIRVWDVTTSKTTGRISATRTTHLHVNEGVSKPTKEPAPNVEDVGVFADHEPNRQSPTKPATKRRRAKTARKKENDSVSSMQIPPSKPIITRR